MRQKKRANKEWVTRQLDDSTFALRIDTYRMECTGGESFSIGRIEPVVACKLFKGLVLAIRLADERARSDLDRLGFALERTDQLADDQLGRIGAALFVFRVLYPQHIAGIL